MIVSHRPTRPDRMALQRKPDFRFTRRKHLRRHDTDDGVNFAGEIERPTEHRRIALEKSLPKLIADDGQSRTADAIFLFGENAAELRLEPDDLEKVRRHDRAGNLFRLAAFESAQVVGLAPADGESFEKPCSPFSNRDSPDKKPRCSADWHPIRSRSRADRDRDKAAAGAGRR